MARDYTTQRIANYGGLVRDYGYVQFSGTDATVEIDTVLSRIRSVSLSPADAQFGQVANYAITETVDNGEINVPSSGKVTLSRIPEGGGSYISNLKVWYSFEGID